MDILSDFDQREVKKVSSRYRLVGILRIPNLLFMFFFLVILILQVLDAQSQSIPAYFITAVIMGLIFGALAIVAIIYTVKQFILELQLNPKLFWKSRLRWANYIINIVFSFGAISTACTQYTFDSRFAFPIISFLSLSLYFLFIFSCDLRYFILRRRRKAALKKNGSTNL